MPLMNAVGYVGGRGLAEFGEEFQLGFISNG